MIQKATLFFGLVCLGACSSRSSAPLPTSNIPTFKTEVIAKTSMRQLFEATLRHLSQEGYEIKDDNLALGYISAIKSYDLETYSQTEPFGPPATSVHHSDRVLIEVNAHLVQLKSDSKIRINLTQKIVNKNGEVMSASPVQASEAYDQIIGKIKSIERAIEPSKQPAKKQK